MMETEKEIVEYRVVEISQNEFICHLSDWKNF